MVRGGRPWVGALVSLLCLVWVAPRSLAAQTLHTLTPSQARVFPQVTGGVAAMKEDSSGRFFVVPKPPSAILVYDAGGNFTGRIPNAMSGGVALRYISDFDLDPAGDLLVADRGSNSVYTFAPDGSLLARVAVPFPTSVVALVGGQFAVTSLRADHPIEIFAADGRLVRGFGNEMKSSPPADDSAPRAALSPDLGRITGDSAGNVYFIPLSDADPKIHKFDRFGYLAFTATVPAPAPEDSAPEDRIQLGFSFARLTRSSQISSFVTLGDSGKMQFGSSVGAGLASLLGEGSRGGGAGAIAGTVTAETSLKTPSFRLHLGMKANQRPGRGGGGLSAGGNSATLQYGSQTPFDDPSILNSFQDSGTLAYSSGNSPPGFSSPAIPGSLSASPVSQAGLGSATDAADISTFFLGSAGPHPGGYERHFLGLPGAGGPAASPGTGGASGKPPEFGRGGRFDASSLRFAGTLRVNLDKPRAAAPVSNTITAVTVDRQTQEIWAAMGPLLVHFDKQGDLLSTYYLASPQGAILQVTAIVVDADRLFIGSEGNGVYQFARPDIASSSITGHTSAAPPHATPQP